MLEQRLYLAQLYDIYGPLLTEKQQQCLEMHLLEDFSMSEIGEELGVSRQAVYDILHRSEQIMADYEAKLGLAGRVAKRQRELSEIYDALAALDEGSFSHAMPEILQRLESYTDRESLREEKI